MQVESSAAGSTEEEVMRMFPFLHTPLGFILAALAWAAGVYMIALLCVGHVQAQTGATTLVGTIRDQSRGLPLALP